MNYELFGQLTITLNHVNTKTSYFINNNYVQIGDP